MNKKDSLLSVAIYALLSTRTLFPRAQQPDYLPYTTRAFELITSIPSSRHVSFSTRLVELTSNKKFVGLSTWYRGQSGTPSSCLPSRHAFGSRECTKLTHERETNALSSAYRSGLPSNGRMSGRNPTPARL
ncbi:hypothetical protein M3J09_012994 [Ascochyta lentis]